MATRSTDTITRVISWLGSIYIPPIDDRMMCSVKVYFVAVFFCCTLYNVRGNESHGVRVNFEKTFGLRDDELLSHDRKTVLNEFLKILSDNGSVRAGKKIVRGSLKHRFKDSRSKKICHRSSRYTMVPELGSAYKLHPEKVTWTEARRICRTEDAHLAIPDGPEELIHLVDMATQAGLSESLIHSGFHYSCVFHRFVTVLGDPMVFSSWANGEPRKHSKKCGSLYASVLAKSGFNDVDCSRSELPFICEKPESEEDRRRSLATRLSKILFTDHVQ